MKIDFRNIEVTDLEGNKSTFDVRKELGNTIYNSTTDLGELEFAQEVYKHGEVEVDSEKAEIIRKYMEVGRFFARIKKGVFDLLDSIDNEK
mgnify:FL=1